jgi:hypothetical protein
VVDGICFGVTTVVFAFLFGFIGFFIGEHTNFVLPPVMISLVAIALGAFCAYQVLE